MTSEPDSKPDRRPPTIELKATEVPSATSAQDPDATARAADDPPGSNPASNQAEPEQPTGGNDRRWRKSTTMSAAFGAVAAAAILAGLWIAGFGPGHEAAVPADQPATSAAAPTIGADIAARLDKIERAMQPQRPDPALGTRLTATETQTKSLADALSALNRRLDDIAAVSQNASKQAATAADAAKNAAKDAASATNANQSTVQRNDLDALASRIAALESAVKALSDNEPRQPVSANDRAARLTVAAEALRAAVERGAPYGAELGAVQALGTDENAIAPLEPFAAGGVPSAAALSRELLAITTALQRASGNAPEETTFLGRLKAHAEMLVRVTPVDAPAGNNPTTGVARIAADARRADIAAALTDIATLPDSAKPLTADWVKRAQAREAALAASRQIAADALAALSKPASQ